ncbi:hypothetical protein P167DRAFT_401377 [Morchella conica CCBAS932]|uniref:Uncharacterized protein n=1 Tax=Morchella conica CCBAS932 TaxID=1392247 RepID=A0A3N4KAC6_9PEZI|nr:hypothetical protein P167DRAFT_401377 [Morchella conica CCBAS932]
MSRMLYWWGLGLYWSGKLRIMSCSFGCALSAFYVRTLASSCSFHYVHTTTRRAERETKTLFDPAWYLPHSVEEP